jgi:flagellar motor switch protein FliN/FliY
MADNEKNAMEEAVLGGGAAREAAYDIQVELYAVLGHANVQVKQLLKLGRGAVVELDRKINEPIDLFVNKMLVGRGEVVVVDDRLGVTVTDMLKGQRGD